MSHQRQAVLLEPADDSCKLWQTISGMDMNRITPKRAAVFICVMATIAIFIYSAQGHREQQRAAGVAQQQHEAANAIATQKAVEDAAAQHANFLTRYVNTGFSKKSGIRMIALSVTSGRTVQEAIANHFKSDSIEILPSFFKPAFITDGLFEQAFNGVGDISIKLELAKSLDALLLARQEFEYLTNGPDLNNVITANLRITIAIVPVASTVQSQTWTFSSKGAGFTPSDARALAEERVLKQITEDTKMSLN
jgi:hypothetical protein